MFTIGNRITATAIPVRETEQPKQHQVAYYPYIRTGFTKSL